MPRKRGSLNFRAEKSVKNVFGAYIDASPIVVMPPFHNASSDTGVRLTGRVCGSAGSFCAVTVTVGSVTCAGGWLLWAAAIEGVTQTADATEKTSSPVVRLKPMRAIMQRTYGGTLEGGSQSVPLFVPAPPKPPAVRWPHHESAMLKRLLLAVPFVFALGILGSAQRSAAPAADPTYRVAIGDWPEARGPHRNGVSDEKGLIDK